MNTKMLSYIAKRLLLALFTIFLVITITFILMKSVPSSPFIKTKAVPEAVMRALEAKYGLDKPTHIQYFNYLKNAAVMDFGESIHYRGQEVSMLVLNGFSTSLKIGGMAALIALIVGLTLGAIAALRRDKGVDKVILVVTTGLVSTPNFVAGLLMLWILGVWLGLLPTRGDIPGGLIMPVVSLCLNPCAYITRLTRSSMLDVLGQDYIRTARAKGLAKKRVLFMHALKNALTPVITYLGPMTAGIITGSFVVEQIFSVSGLGKYFVNSIQNSDYPMIMGTTVFLAMIIIALNLVCDLLYTVVDKRVNLQ